MQQLILLTAALEFIEQNLDSNIKTSDIADACYCSKSTIEKMFRCITNLSVHDYILRRKMTSAARLILSDTANLPSIEKNSGTMNYVQGCCAH